MRRNSELREIKSNLCDIYIYNNIYKTQNCKIKYRITRLDKLKNVRIVRYKVAGTFLNAFFVLRGRKATKKVRFRITCQD